MVSKLNMIKRALKKLNAEGFNDMNAADIHTLHNLTRCQAELQNDVTNQ